VWRNAPAPLSRVAFRGRIFPNIYRGHGFRDICSLFREQQLTGKGYFAGNLDSHLILTSHRENQIMRYVRYSSRT